MILKLFLSTAFALIATYVSHIKNFLPSTSGDLHQKFIETKPTPLIGGIILFISIFIYGFNQLNLFFVFCFLILLIGFFSDTEKKISPLIRLILQTFIILITILVLDTTIAATGYALLDLVLNDSILSIFFTAFCILILVNGSNFIDGTNLNAVGYYFVLSIILFNLENFDIFYLLNFEIYNLIFILSVILILNLFNKLYLGDSGSYLLGFIFGFELISFYNQNVVSPFFIILLLWYPCFEMLFSIFRKLNFKRSPLKPDSKHFHQLLYFSINKKVKNPFISSNLSGFFISLYNLIIMMFASTNFVYTEFQIILIGINILVYTFVYLRFINS